MISEFYFYLPQGGFVIVTRISRGSALTARVSMKRDTYRHPMDASRALARPLKSDFIEVKSGK
jgi:hypothetical protein